MVVFNCVYIQQNNLIFVGVLVTFEPRGLKLIFFKGPLTAMYTGGGYMITVCVAIYFPW